MSPKNATSDSSSTQPPASLRRGLNLPLLVFYGVGTTVGAGVYALLGEVSKVAGALAPWAFVGASALAAFTAASFAELARRYPQSAATAKYVEQGFSSRQLGLCVGLLVITAAVVSGAVLLQGMANYVLQLVSVPSAVIIVGTALVLALISVWGIRQSAWLASFICILEVGGLIWISGLSTQAINWPQVEWSALRPNAAALPAVATAAVLAFYAYIGFEDMVEVAEEVRDVQTTMPLAIAITLVLTSTVYVVLVLTTQLAVSVEVLSNASAPVAEVYRQLTGRDPYVISLIGILAIVNGILIQMIMASRVIYGLARRAQLPSLLGRVHGRTQTPIVATLVVVGIMLPLALLGELAVLAQVTSIVMLVVFGLVNLSLWRLKGQPSQAPEHGDVFPRWFSLLGFVACAAVVAHAVGGMFDLS